MCPVYLYVFAVKGLRMHLKIPHKPERKVKMGKHLQKRKNTAAVGGSLQTGTRPAGEGNPQFCGLY